MLFTGSRDRHYSRDRYNSQERRLHVFEHYFHPSSIWGYRAWPAFKSSANCAIYKCFGQWLFCFNCLFTNLLGLGPPIVSRNFVQRILNILALAFRLMSILYIKFQFIFHPSQLPYRKLWLNFSIKILRLNFPPRCCLSSWKQQQAVVNGTHGQTFQTGLCIHAALGCECFYLKQRYWFVQSRSRCRSFLFEEINVINDWTVKR